MSPLLAFHLLTWAAVAVLFFGLAAVLREVRLLRAMIGRPDGFSAAAPDIVLGPAFADGVRRRMVLAVDSGCPLCLAVTERLARREPGAVLLTHEPAEVWAGVAGPLQVVSDRGSWREISHLAPPVLMLVEPSGLVRRMVLPVREEEVDTVSADWHDLVQEGASGVAELRADS